MYINILIIRKLLIINFLARLYAISAFKKRIPHIYLYSNRKKVM